MFIVVKYYDYKGIKTRSPKKSKTNLPENPINKENLIFLPKNQMSYLV